MSEPSVDLGRCWAGAEVAHSFEFHNGGELPLRIERVGVSCGCLQRRIERVRDGESTEYVLGTAIQPGERGRIVVEVDTLARSERDSLRVSVHSNDPAQPRTALRLALKVDALFTLDPPLVTEGDVASTEVLQRGLHVRPPDGSWVALERVTGLPDGWSLLRENGERVGESIDDSSAVSRDQLSLTLRAPYASQSDLAHGVFHLWCRTGAVDGAWPVRVRVAAGRIAAVEVTPRFVMFDTRRRGEEHIFECEISTPLSGARLEVESTHFDSEAADHLIAELEPADDPQRQRLLVVLLPDIPPGDLRADLWIHTNLERDPLRVRIAGRILEAH